MGVAQRRLQTSYSTGLENKQPSWKIPPTILWAFVKRTFRSGRDAEKGWGRPIGDKGRFKIFYILISIG
jgi:hypothetical protein